MTALIGRTATLRELVTLAWPILVSMLSITIMSIVDTLFVSALGTLALASLGLALPVVYLVLSFPMGPLSAVKIVAAQATGAGEERRARALGWQSLWLALGLGLVAILLTPVAWLVLDLLAEGADSAWLARTFCSVRLVSAPLTFASLGLTGWFQGRGDTRTPMVAVLLANATNIALDPVLIFGLGPIPALGVGGAALATNLAEVVGVPCSSAADSPSSGPSVAYSMSGRRRRSSSKATRSSMRARLAPRQKWLPMPKARWCGLRSMSNASGFSNSSSSRFAEP